MTQEKGKEKVLSPYDRFNMRFNGIEGKDSIRRIVLGDETNIVLEKRRESWVIGESCIISIKSQGISFSINPGGLRWTEIPGLEFGEPSLLAPNRRNFEIYLIQQRTAIAKVLIDWLDKIVEENRYSNPQIKVLPFR